MTVVRKDAVSVLLMVAALLHAGPAGAEYCLLPEAVCDFERNAQEIYEDRGAWVDKQIGRLKDHAKSYLPDSARRTIDFGERHNRDLNKVSTTVFDEIRSFDGHADSSGSIDRLNAAADELGRAKFEEGRTAAWESVKSVMPATVRRPIERIEGWVAEAEDTIQNAEERMEFYGEKLRNGYDEYVGERLAYSEGGETTALVADPDDAVFLMEETDVVSPEEMPDPLAAETVEYLREDLGLPEDAIAYADPNDDPYLDTRPEVYGEEFNNYSPAPEDEGGFVDLDDLPQDDGDFVDLDDLPQDNGDFVDLDDLPQDNGDSEADPWEQDRFVDLDDLPADNGQSPFVDLDSDGPETGPFIDLDPDEPESGPFIDLDDLPADNGQSPFVDLDPDGPDTGPFIDLDPDEPGAFEELDTLSNDLQYDRAWAGEEQDLEDELEMALNEVSEAADEEWSRKPQTPFGDDAYQRALWHFDQAMQAANKQAIRNSIEAMNAGFQAWTQAMQQRQGPEGSDVRCDQARRQVQEYDRAIGQTDTRYQSHRQARDLYVKGRNANQEWYSANC